MDELEVTKWLLNRKQGIGGSDIGALLGLSPYNTAVDIYYDKITNNIDTNQSIPQRRGHYLEHFIADLYAEETGHIVTPNGDTIYKHPLEDFMLVTPDYWFMKPYETDNKQYLLELKSAVGRGVTKWLDGVPDYIKVQCQHQMFVCGGDTMDLAYLINDDFGYLTYERDEDLIEKMVSVASDFWYNNVLKEIPPDPHTLSDYKQVYATAVEKSKVECSDELLRDLAKLLEMKELEKLQAEAHAFTKNIISDLDLNLRSYMRDYEELYYDDMTLATYKNIKNGSRRLSIKSKNIWG